MFKISLQPEVDRLHTQVDTFGTSRTRLALGCCPVDRRSRVLHCERQPLWQQNPGRSGVEEVLPENTHVRMCILWGRYRYEGEMVEGGSRWLVLPFDACKQKIYVGQKISEQIQRRYLLAISA